MPSATNGHSATAIDFATSTVHGDPVTTDEKNEVIETLRELLHYFGESALLRAISDLGVVKTSAANSNEQVLAALRAYSVLILESDRPVLTVQLVGKLAGLELATGKRIILRELGAAEGITKQAVSKRLSLYAERLGLPRPDSTEEARASYATHNRRNYASRPPTATP